MVYRDMTQTSLFSGLPDRDLVSEVKRLAQVERGATAALVASLAEMDRRRLYLGEGCSSLFAYCTRVLHLSEHAAYARIEAARAARRFPIVLERFERGELTLTNICLLRPHLREANYAELLDAVRHASKRDVERLVARIAPQPDVQAAVRKLPTVRPPAAPASEASLETQPPCIATTQHAPEAVSMLHRPSVPLVQPLAPERYKVQFTVSRETHDRLRRAQNLLRHSIPDGDVAAIFDRALTTLVEQLERSKLAAARVPRRSRAPAGKSRRIPAAVRRAVWKRDEGRCAFEGPEGRCGEPGFLEFHHVVPFAHGGRATVDNIQLRCRAHNQYEAVQDFGVLLTREAAPAYAPCSLQHRSFGVILEHATG